MKTTARSGRSPAKSLAVQTLLLAAKVIKTSPKATPLDKREANYWWRKMNTGSAH